MERVSAGQGLSWIRGGWTLLRLKPGAVIGSVLLMYILLFVAQMLPFVGGIVAMVLAPFLAGGVYLILQRVGQIAAEVEAEPLAREQAVSFDLLFSLFKQPEKRRALLGLAAVALMFNLVMLILFVVFVGTSLGGLEHNALTDSATTDQQKMQMLMPILFSAKGMWLWLIVLTLSAVYAMATLFAVPQIALDGVGLVEALKQSFRAVGHNWLPFLTYGLVWMLLYIVFVPITVGLALIVLIPLGVASVYIAYRNIWPEPEEGDDGTAKPPVTPPRERSSTVM